MERAPCRVTDCQTPQAKGKRGLCNAHYLRWYRHGDPLGGKPAARPRIPSPCAYCLELFVGKHSQSKYCSQACFHASRRGHGVGSIDGMGYKVLWIEGRAIREHRYVMEHILGRPLASHELVHHLDHDKLNNNRNNLAITTRQLHPRQHATFRNDTHKACSRCGAILPRSAFSPRKNHGSRDPHVSACRQCCTALPKL